MTAYLEMIFFFFWYFKDVIKGKVQKTNYEIPNIIHVYKIHMGLFRDCNANARKRSSQGQKKHISIYLLGKQMKAYHSQN